MCYIQNIKPGAGGGGFQSRLKSVGATRVERIAVEKGKWMVDENARTCLFIQLKFSAYISEKVYRGNSTNEKTNRTCYTWYLEKNNHWVFALTWNECFTLPYTISVINWLQHFHLLKIQILGTEITFQSAIKTITKLDWHRSDSVQERLLWKHPRCPLLCSPLFRAKQEDRNCSGSLLWAFVAHMFVILSHNGFEVLGTSKL